MKSYKKTATIAVFGLGRIGLPLALSLADKNFTVYGVERSKVKNKFLLRGEMPFEEPGAEELLKKNIGKNFNPSALRCEFDRI